MANNFQAALIFNMALSAQLKDDPEAGAKIAQAVQDKLTDATATATVSYNGLPAVQVVLVHPANSVSLIASGANKGVDLGTAGGVDNLAPENIRELLQAGAQNYGLVVRSEASERDPEEKAKTAAKAKATREATAQRKIREAAEKMLREQGKL